MKITKRQLRNIVKREARLMRENAHELVDAVEIVSVDPPLGDSDLGTSVVAESLAPEQALVVEMEVASRALEQVVESVQNAAQLCAECSPAIAVQAPLVEAMVAQAEALQETIEAQTEVVLENAEVSSSTEDAGLVDLVASALS